MSKGSSGNGESGGVWPVGYRFLVPSTMFLLSHGSALGKEQVVGRQAQQMNTVLPPRSPGTQFSQRRENLPSLGGVYSHNNRFSCETDLTPTV